MKEAVYQINLDGLVVTKAISGDASKGVGIVTTTSEAEKPFKDVIKGWSFERVEKYLLMLGYHKVEV